MWDVSSQFSSRNSLTCNTPRETNQQMVLTSVYVQLACYQSIWYLVRSTLGHTHRQQTERLTGSQTIILHITNTKKQSYKQDVSLHRQPKPPKPVMMDLPSRQNHSQILLLIQQTCQADKPTDKSISVMCWTFQEQTDGQTCRTKLVVLVFQKDRHIQSAYLRWEIRPHGQPCENSSHLLDLKTKRVMHSNK